jgi:hypothetical protein
VQAAVDASGSHVPLRATGYDQVYKQYDAIDAQTIWETIMNIKPIKTKANYRAALKDIESLMTAKANTPEGDRLDVLTTLIEAYERAHFPMDLPDAVERSSSGWSNLVWPSKISNPW